jgi:gliding motility-associated-like protein
VSSDITIATVSTTGLVTGVSDGISTITYTNSNGCTTTADVTVNPLPTITDNAPICIGATVQLTGSATANGTTPWVSSDITIATVSATGLVTGVSDGISTITYTNSNGCTTTADVTVNPDPIITGATSICINATVQLTGSATASGTTPWVSSDITIATVSTTGLVTGVSDGTTTITYTNTNGCQNTVSITVDPSPIINTGQTALTACNANDGIITVSDLGLLTGTINWTGTATGSVSSETLPFDITGLAAGTYDVTFTDDATGCTSLSSQEVLINPGAPALNPVTDTTSCDVDYTLLNTIITGVGLTGGQAFYTATGGPTGAGTLIADGTVYSAPTNITVFLYDINGACASEQFFNIVINPLPIITDNAPICIGATVQLTGSATANGTTPWVSSDITIATVSATGLVTGVSDGISTITYTNSNGCTTTADVTVNPDPTITDNAPICIGATVQLTGSATANGTTPWVSSDITIATVSATGLVTGVSDGISTITYTNSNGCTTTADVTVNADPIINTGQTALTACNSDDGIIDVSDLGLLTGTINWTGMETGSISSETLPYDITGLASGTYNITFTDDVTGCTSASYQEILVNPGAPIINDLVDVVVCDSFIFPVISGAALSGGQSYWSETGGAGTQFSSGDVVYTTGLFFIYDINGTCSDEENFNVTIVNTPVLDPIVDVINCESYTIPLIISGTNLSPNAAFYTNSQLNGGTVLTGNLTTTQTVWVYDTNGDCSDEISFEVTINSLPTLVSINGGAEYCENQPINEIIVDLTGSPDWIIDYTLDGISQTITSTTSSVSLGNVAGVYVLTNVTDLYCSNVITGTQTITINDLPSQPNASDDIEHCVTIPGDDLVVEGSGNIFTWYSDIELTQVIGTGSTLTPNSDVGLTTYYVTETVKDCEGAADEVIVTIINCTITVPTAFTPNGDANTDDWEILNIDQTYPNNVVTVYNRWGNLLFESEPGLYDQNRWDGTYDNKRLPVGSYFFIIEFNDGDGGSRTGSVSIIDNK